ncbi:unnamed protein product [Psylliodes chrysocephalus]|uniref:Uncharacterized protein n=1 Tax=Psylliodes chrysocephalus TaxID=3402493 RepID=A0A9P0D4V6_9CUCU|nr:unnamed protein product [Psylliodes chrysocephala]
MNERKRNQRNNPNISTFIRRPIASKIGSHNLTLLNETSRENNQNAIRGPANKSLILKDQLDLVYNSYLQALLKQEIAENQIKKREKVLNGQILLQEENVAKRKECLNQIQKEADLLIKKEEIVKMIKNLEENINKINGIYANYQIQKHVQTVHGALTYISGTLVLKNIKSLENKDQEKLVDSVKKLTLATEKIVNCGRDFEGVHKLAEDCRNLIQIVKKIKESQLLLSTMEENAELTVLQKLSDEFAKQYENVEQKT